MRSANKCLAAVFLCVAACGDDAQAPAACPAGADAGAMLECECEDAATGTQLCRADGTLDECDCENGGGGSGGAGSGGAGSGGAGSGGNGSGGTGGDSGGDGDGDGDDDAGAEPDGGAGTDGGTNDGGMTDGGPLPMNGEQLAVCADDDDCDTDLGCYVEGGGQHFCTATCSENTDCDAIDGAEYTCSEDGLCEVVCMRLDDTSCPDGLTCLMTSGPGPGGIQFRCKYSETAGQTASEAFGVCSTSDDCVDGLECVGAVGPILGYCTHDCTDTEDCTEAPTSGSIEPSCAQTGPMPSSESCVLDCSDDAAGCPDGMTCGLMSRCVPE